MTGRATLLLAALAAGGLQLAPPVAAAPLGNRPASITFEIPADHGLRAKVETFAGEATLEISGQGRGVTYKVRAESTESGLSAKFGKLGEIDVDFEPTKMRTEKPPPGCSGMPWRSGEGVFTGTIRFTGEREYVRLDATRAEGDLWVAEEWHCPHHEARPKPVDEPDVATLSAYARRCQCFFAAYSFAEDGRRQSVFIGAKLEHREGMEIGRVTTAEAGASAFVFDHAAGMARAKPPSPFTGSGEYVRRAHGRDRWRSTIRVPLLGADPLGFSGPAFRARLVRDLPGD